jgi:excisionase family DNA binding protein
MCSDCTQTNKHARNCMKGLTTIGGKYAAAPLPRLYLRPDEAARVIGISRRTLSEWQSSRVIGFRRIGRTVLFSVADIQTAIDRYRIAPVGEPKPRKQHFDADMTTAPVPTSASGIMRRKRRMQGIAPEPTTQ